ncbi:MAG: nucleoside hydrolase [Ruminococcaceae bacterium]|nr:nucleoside hydrolase [Oscillospiraceae bacterium]
MKILLDTDIGCDIDDCLAIPYLLSSERVELLGITTVTGSPNKRAQLARAVCDACGKDIPIHVGFAEPLSGPLYQTALTDTQEAVAKQSSVAYSEEPTAIEFMRQIIEDNPHEVTLVSIGPLTNIGVLFSEYPHIPSLLKGLAIMGGRYTNDPDFDTARWGKKEWNIHCDIKAANIVFSQCASPCLVIGVEQTCRFSVIPQPLKETLFRYPQWRPVSDSINTVAKSIYFHDVILLYSLLHPEDVEIICGNISVDSEGTTEFTSSDEGMFCLVSGYDPYRFFESYKEALGIELQS